MSARIKAGVELRGSNLRYAEVESRGDRYRLLRLGSCDFDFDVEAEIFGSDEPSWLGTVGDALKDVFEGSMAESLTFAVHPPSINSLFVPVFEGLSDEQRSDQLRRDAAIALAGEDKLYSDDAYRREVIDDGGPIEWYDVVSVDPVVHDRLDSLSAIIPQKQLKLVLSMRGAASAAQRALSHTYDFASASKAFILGIGWYPSHAEFVVCERDRFYFAGHSPAVVPADVAYFATSLINELKLSMREVGRIFLYGENVKIDEFNLVSRVFQAPIEMVNPLGVLDLEPEALVVNFSAEAYVPCIGVSL